MTANELFLKAGERNLAHSRGINFETGESYPVEEHEILQAPPTIAELMELVANGQPINSFLTPSTSGEPEDDEGVAEDDKEDWKRAEKAFKKAEKTQVFDDNMMAVAYVKERLSEKEFEDSMKDVAKTPSEPGTEPGTDSGTEPGTEPETDPGTEPGTDS